MLRSKKIGCFNFTKEADRPELFEVKNTEIKTETQLIQEKVSKYRPALLNLGKDVNAIPQQEQFESELTKIRI